MTNIQKISNTDPNRIKTLEARYERLIAANLNKRYLSTPKAKRYLDTIKTVKVQINKRMMENQAKNANSPLSQFLKSTYNLDGFGVLMSNRKSA